MTHFATKYLLYRKLLKMPALAAYLTIKADQAGAGIDAICVAKQQLNAMGLVYAYNVGRTNLICLSLQQVSTTDED